MRTKYKLRGILLSWLWIVMCQIVMFAQQPNAMLVANEVPFNTLLQQAEDLAYKDPAEANRLLDLAWKESTSENSAARFAIMRCRGLVDERNTAFDDAYKHYQDALALVTNVGDRITILQDLAIIEKKRANYIASSEYYNKTLELATAQQDWEMVQAALDGLGSLHEAISDFENALKYQLQSLEVARKHKDTYGELICYQNIAVTHGKSKNYDLALENSEKAYHLALQLKDTLQLANIYYDKGNILIAQGYSLKSLAEHQRALTLFESIGFKSKVAKSLMSNGEIFVNLNQLDKAESYLVRAFEMEDQLWNYDQVKLHLVLGELYIKRKKYDQADTSLNKAILLSRRFKQLDTEEAAYKLLAQLKAESGEMQLAYEYQVIATSLNDSLFSLAQTRQRAEQQFKFNVGQLDEEITSLKSQKERASMISGLGILALLVVSLGVILITQSLHNRKLRTQKAQLRDQNARLEESNGILKQFAYAAAHDLKEPLRTIGSFTSLLERRNQHQLDDSSKEYMQYITSGVSRMNSLLTDLLHFSTFFTQDAVKEMTNTNDVLNGTLANLQTTIQQKKAKVEVLNPLPTLSMSSFHVGQLLQNIISNALKFVETEPVIKISSIEQGKVAVIKIEDNGIGMAEEHSTKIFNLFHQLHRHSGKYEGTGVGLTICKNIVDKYHGRITVQSREGQGTCFMLYLPMS